MIFRAILVFLFIFSLGKLTVKSEVRADKHSVSGYDWKEDYPVCEKPFRAKLYSIADNQLIIHVDEEAKPELFYFRVHVEGDDISGGGINAFYEITHGHIQMVNDIRINTALAVRIQRVCFFGATNIEVESEWIVLKSSGLSGNRMVSGGGIDCELFNGAQTQFVNGAWRTNLEGLLSFFSTGGIGGPASSELDSILVVFHHIGTRGDTISTETLVIYPTSSQNSLRVNLSNLFGLNGSQTGNIIMQIGWWDGPGGSTLNLCDGVIILGLGGEYELTCGDDLELTPSTNQTPLAQLNIDDVFFINVGFPVQVTAITSTSPTFKGEGLLAIPFKEDKLIVEFDCKINQHYWVTSGEVKQVGDTIVNLEGVFVIGNATCYKSEDEWGEDGRHKDTGEFYDNNGFAQDGQYILDPPYEGYEEGMPYDPDFNPCGFDVSGNYLDTGSKYNEDGCSIEGVKADGTVCSPWPCNTPYFWLGDGDPANEEGLSLANKYKDSLENLIIVFIDSLLYINNDSLAAKTLCVTGKKTDLLSYSGSLNLDQELMFGEELEYISIGCSELFVSEPKPLQINIIPRNDTIVMIENTHIELYHCDKERIIYSLREILLNEQKETENLDISVKELLYRIRRLNEADASDFDSNYTAFVLWVNEFLEDKFQLLFEGNYIPGPFDINGGGTQGLKNSNSSGSHHNGNDENIDSNPGDQFESSGEITSTPGETGSGSDNGRRRIKKPDFGVDRFSFNNFSTEREYTINERRGLYLNQLINERIVSPTTESRSSGGGILSPLTISKDVGGIVYSIILDNFRITAAEAELDAYAVIDDANTGNKIVFSGKNIGFGLNGFSQDSLKVFLESDIELRLINPATLRILGGEGTYVLFNCEGYISAGIEAEVEFCPNYLLPVDPVTDAVIENDTERVKATFNVEMQNWGNFTVAVDIDPFVIVDAPNLIWTIQGAELDFSDHSSPNIIFPNNYNSYLVAPNGSPMPEWKGFYLEELSVKMLGGIGQNSSTPISIAVQKMVIDNTGFTGQFGVGGDFVTLGDGDLGGWSFSMDTIGINIVANRLVGGGFGGKINVPILKSDPNTSAPDISDCVDYFAAYQPDGSLAFDVSSIGTYGASVWKAELELSRISIKGTISDEEIALEAIFSGSLTADVSESNLNFKIPELSFQDLTIRNQPNYFEPGMWKVSDSLGFSFSGLSFGLSNIGLTGADDPDYFDLDFTVSFGIGAEELSINAAGHLSMRGKIEVAGGKQKYVYHSFNVNGFAIDADIKGVMRVKGEILFFENHAQYGKGFYGNIEAEMPKFGGIGMNAAAIFGTHNTGYKYFMVDVGVKFGKGVPLSPIPLSLTGIGGGVYFKMAREDLFDGLPSEFNNPTTPTLGTSCSGIKYVPDNTVFMGLTANIAFTATSGESVFNGNAGLYIEFNNINNKIAGIKTIGIDGNAQFMEQPDIGRSSQFSGLSSTTGPGGVMSAWISLKADFENSTFSGEFAAFLNAGLIRGAGTNNLLGKAEVYFGPDGWFINIGRPEPEERLGIALSIPGMGKVAEVKSYFCVGTKIPDIPPLPAQFAAFNSMMQQQNNLRKTGKGVAFGTSMNITTGELKFLIFYGSFDLGAGFDVMLKDYGDLVCDNNQQIGINGWYATGQVYAYIGAEIGLVFRKKRITIIQASVNAALRAQLPNPFYAVGTVGGSYRLLGGLIKGTCRFNLEIGEKCSSDLNSSNPNAEIIFDIYPAEGTEEFDVFDNPRIDLLVPIGRKFDYDGRKFELKVEEFRVIKDNVELNNGQYNIINDGYTIEMKSRYPLFNNDSITFIYKLGLSFELKFPINQVITEYLTDTIGFFTGSYPDRFIPDNITATYPMHSMLNFYKKEFNQQKGYIKFEKSQMQLFEKNASTEPFIRLVDSSDNRIVPLNFEYDLFSNTLFYELPPHELVNGKMYTVQFGRTHLSGWVGKPLKSIGLHQVGSRSSIINNSNDDIIATKREDEVFHIIDFRVSLFETFAEKIEKIFLETVNTSFRGVLSTKTEGIEPFDSFEVSSISGKKPLVEFSAQINSNQFNFCYNCNKALHRPIFASLPYVFSHLRGESIVFGPCEYDNCLEFDHRIGVVQRNAIKANFVNNDFSNSLITIGFDGFNKIKNAMAQIYSDYAAAWQEQNESLIEELLYDPGFSFEDHSNHPFGGYKPSASTILAPNGDYAKLVIKYTLPEATTANTTITKHRLD